MPLTRGRGFQIRALHLNNRTCADSKFFLCASGLPTSCLERFSWPKVYYLTHAIILCELASSFSLVTPILPLVALRRPAIAFAQRLLPSWYMPEKMNYFVACRRCVCWINLLVSCVKYQSSYSASYQHIIIPVCLKVACVNRRRWASNSALHPLTLKLYNYLWSYVSDSLCFERLHGCCWNCSLLEGCCRTGLAYAGIEGGELHYSTPSNC